MDIREELKKLFRNGIELEIGNSTEYKLGGTRLGGLPDVPKDFVWPTFECENYENITKVRPLSFIAQFNCEEIAEFDKDNLLPKIGVLSFFYELGTMCWGFDQKDIGCARVFWFEDISRLSPMELPKDLDKEFQLPQVKITATSKKSLPQYQDFKYLDYSNTILWEEYDKIRMDMLGIKDLEENIYSRLLGWPDIIQNNMTDECELISRGYYLGGNWNNIPQDVKEEVTMKSKEDWILLFQLDSIWDKELDFDLCFGDSGSIYFYIRKEDLLQRRFDRVWLILQCF